jgi:putative oxidoreductase
MRLDLALLVLRLTGLYLALGHGLGKVTALASGESGFVAGVERLGFPQPTVFAWAAALAELLGGLLVAFGCFTRAAAALAAVTMCVAAFARHKAHLQGLAALGLGAETEEAIKSWGDPEKALLYLIVLLAILLTGPGAWSVDHAFGRGRGGRRR